MSEIVVSCPTCRATVSVGDEFRGQRVRCGACGGFFAVAARDSSAGAPAPFSATSNPSPFAESAYAPPPANVPSAPVSQHGNAAFNTGGFRCPCCMSPAGVYRSEQISTAGWVVFAVMMVTCWPLFWIGLLIKEDIQRCRSCSAKIG